MSNKIKSFTLTIVMISSFVVLLYFYGNKAEVVNQPAIKDRDGVVNFDEALIYRQVISEGDTLRTILADNGCVMYVPRWWTAQAIDSVIITLFGKQNWYGSE